MFVLPVFASAFLLRSSIQRRERACVGSSGESGGVAKDILGAGVGGDLVYNTRVDRGADVARETPAPKTRRNLEDGKNERQRCATDLDSRNDSKTRQGSRRL